MGAHKQSARRSSHRKPKPFQDMGKFSYAGSHRRNPREREDVKLGHFRVAWKTFATRGCPPRATMNSRRFNRLFRISRHRFDDRKVDIT
jgi:hypothetical protein